MYTYDKRHASAQAPEDLRQPLVAIRPKICIDVALDTKGSEQFFLPAAEYCWPELSSSHSAPMKQSAKTCDIKYS